MHKQGEPDLTQSNVLQWEHYVLFLFSVQITHTSYTETDMPPYISPLLSTISWVNNTNFSSLVTFAISWLPIITKDNDYNTNASFNTLQLEFLASLTEIVLKC